MTLSLKKAAIAAGLVILTAGSAAAGVTRNGPEAEPPAIDADYLPAHKAQHNLPQGPFDLAIGNYRQGFSHSGLESVTDCFNKALQYSAGHYGRTIAAICMNPKDGTTITFECDSDYTYRNSTQCEVKQMTKVPLFDNNETRWLLKKRLN